MLVMVCEEVVETLSNMNHPDGNCPLCLYPLVPEWKWLQEENRTRTLSSFFSKTSSPLSIDLEGEGMIQEKAHNHL
ncbi:hypothetical protein AMTRI_Chr05g64540 [Amborella trichopoda]